jgi:transposase
MSPLATSPSRFIGCDVGKASIVVHDLTSGQTFSLPNHPKALADFAASLDPNCLVICEATGGYESALLKALLDAQVPAHRADAAKVKAFIRSFGILGKTDAIDANRLAEYGRERHAGLARWQPPQEDRQRLQSLVLIRQAFVADRVAWGNRAKAPGTEHAAPAIRAMLDFLNEQIKCLNRQIAQLIEMSPPLAQAQLCLRSVIGIGPVVAASLLGLMPELGSLDRRRAAALAGLAPHPRQSGKTDAYRSTRGGRPDVKRTLFMAALAASTTKSALGNFYNRLIDSGKKPLVAITALMRKIIVIANARLRDANAQQLS